MAKTVKKNVAKVKAGQTIDSTMEMINLMITGEKEQKWAKKQLEKEGPKHKKVLTALMFQRLYVLITSIEKSSGVPFATQKGLTLAEEKHKEEIIFPVDIPFDLNGNTNRKKTIEAFTNAPEHEALAYAMFLQVIEWTIKSQEKP